MRPHGQYVRLRDQAHYRSITIENSCMGIHQETNWEIPAAAALNRKLREALARRAGYASSGNGSPSRAHRDAPESVRLWFLDTPLGPVLAGRTRSSGATGGLCLLTYPPEETLRETDALCEYLTRIGRRLDAPVACNGGLGSGDEPDGSGPENGAPVTDPPGKATGTGTHGVVRRSTPGIRPAACPARNAIPAKRMGGAPRPYRTERCDPTGNWPNRSENPKPYER